MGRARLVPSGGCTLEFSARLARVVEDLEALATAARRDGRERVAGALPDQTRRDEPFLAAAVEELADGATAVALRARLDPFHSLPEGGGLGSSGRWLAIGVGALGLTLPLLIVGPDALSRMPAAAPVAVFLVLMGGLAAVARSWVTDGIGTQRVTEELLIRSVIVEGASAIADGASPEGVRGAVAACLPGGPIQTTKVTSGGAEAVTGGNRRAA